MNTTPELKALAKNGGQIHFRGLGPGGTLVVISREGQSIATETAKEIDEIGDVLGKAARAAAHNQGWPLVDPLNPPPILPEQTGEIQDPEAIQDSGAILRPTDKLKELDPHAWETLCAIEKLGWEVRFPGGSTFEKAFPAESSGELQPSYEELRAAYDSGAEAFKKLDEDHIQRYLELGEQCQKVEAENQELKKKLHDLAKQNGSAPARDPEPEPDHPYGSENEPPGFLDPPPAADPPPQPAPPAEKPRNKPGPKKPRNKPGPKPKKKGA